MTQAARMFLILTDDQDRIIPGNRAQDLWDAFVIECGGHWLRTSRSCSQNQLIHCLPDGEPKVRKDVIERRQIVVRSCPVWKSISLGTFEQPQIVDVAREGRLRHIETATLQLLSQLILAEHRAVAQHHPNRVMTFRFHGEALALPG